MNFSGKQLYLIEMLASIDDMRSKEDKAIEAGYAAKSVYRFENQPEVAAEIYRLMRQNISKALPSIYSSLRQSAVKNSGPDARTFLQAAKEIQTGTTVVTNVSQTNSKQEDFQKRIEDRLGEKFEDLLDSRSGVSSGEAAED